MKRKIKILSFVGGVLLAAVGYLNSDLRLITEGIRATQNAIEGEPAQEGDSK